MRPTFDGTPAMSYCSYVYVDRRDISVGDVVTVLAPEFDKTKWVWVKRVAALEKDELRVDPGQSITIYTLSVLNVSIPLVSSVAHLADG